MVSYKQGIASLFAILLLTGCGVGHLDVISYPTKIRDKVHVPEICLPQYKSIMPSVAVVDFTNNSTFGKAKINDTKTNTKIKTRTKGIIAGVASKRTFIAGKSSVSKTKKNKISRNEKREVDAKLSSFITAPLETVVLNSGGANLFTRSDMDKIDAELKYQDSGLVDPKSIVKFGKTAGVKFILTGSIDNVEQNYRGNSEAAQQLQRVVLRSKDDTVKFVSAFLSIGTTITDGMIISSKMTVRLLDVETGKIVFSKQLQGHVNIGIGRNPSYDQVVGGIKESMLKALPNLEKDLAIYFSVKGYITQLRSKDDDIIAQVNIGRDYSVSEDQLFNVYALEENEDPISGVLSCDVIATTIKLKASSQITAKTTWTTVDEGDISFLKLGQLVQKTQEKDGFEIFNF